MLDFLDKFYGELSLGILISFGIAFIGYFFLSLAKESKNSTHKVIGIVLLGQIFLIAFLSLFIRMIVTYYSRKEVIAFVSRENVSIVSNDTNKFDCHSLIGYIKELKNISSHHTGCTARKKYNIASGIDTLFIEIAQDTGNPNEYWVFYDKYSITREIDIGRFFITNSTDTK